MNEEDIENVQKKNKFRYYLKNLNNIHNKHISAVVFLSKERWVYIRTSEPNSTS